MYEDQDGEFICEYWDLKGTKTRALTNHWVQN